MAAFSLVKEAGSVFVSVFYSGKEFNITNMKCNQSRKRIHSFKGEINQLSEYLVTQTFWFASFVARFKTDSSKVADQKKTQIYCSSVESFHGAELSRSIKSSFSLYKQFSRRLDNWATSFAEMWLKAPEEAYKDLKPEIKVSNLLWSVTEVIIWGCK